jgi:predicted RNase H-like HicB family nuclease
MASYHFTARIDPASEGGFVSLCPELGVASQGETVEEAFESLQDAVSTFLETLAELGDLEKFFLERNLDLSKPDPVSGTKPGEFISSLVADVPGDEITV